MTQVSSWGRTLSSKVREGYERVVAELKSRMHEMDWELKSRVHDHVYTICQQGVEFDLDTKIQVLWIRDQANATLVKIEDSSDVASMAGMLTRQADDKVVEAACSLLSRLEAQYQVTEPITGSGNARAE